MNPEEYTPTVPVAPAETTEQKPGPFAATVWEKIFAWLAIPLSFCYVSGFIDALSSYETEDFKWKLLFSIFVVGFMIFGEVLHWKEKRSWEAVLWLVAEIALLVSLIFDLGHVWEQYQLVLFLHLFAGYWLLTRGRRLSDGGKTSRMFVWDGITAFFVLPFKNFHLMVRAMIGTFVVSPDEKGEKRPGRLTALWVVIAFVVAIVLLFIALKFLGGADANFAHVLQGFWDFLEDLFGDAFVLKLILSVHVACYVYGMLGGSFHETKERFANRTRLVERFLDKLKKVPPAVWFVVILVFSVFYVLFFVLQGSYFIDAFKLTLPEGFSYSEYARQGLGDLAGIMVINLLLVWLSTQTASKKNGLVKAGSVIILLESLLFSVISFLKIYMYIDKFGFTPLRLQGVWLAVVLAFACVLALVSVLSGKKTARIWFIGSAVSLVALAFV